MKRLRDVLAFFVLLELAIILLPISWVKAQRSNVGTEARLCGSLQSGQNAAIPSGTTITPTHRAFQVSGTTAVATITAPSGIQGGCTIAIFPTGVFLTTTAGNIVIVSTSVVGKTLFMVWDSTAAKWKPSY